MQIASTTTYNRPANTATRPQGQQADSASQLDSTLDRLERAGDDLVSQQYMKNAWRGAGVALGGAALIIAGTALTMAGSNSALYTGATVAGVGALTSAAGIYISDSNFIAAQQSQN